MLDKYVPLMCRVLVACVVVCVLVGCAGSDGGEGASPGGAGGCSGAGGGVSAGGEIAGLGREVASSEYVVDDARVGRLCGLLEEVGSDSAVMGEVVGSLGVEGVLALVTVVGNHAGRVYRASDEQAATARRTLGLLKEGLGSATQDWEDSQAEGFGGELVRVAVQGMGDGSVYEERFSQFLPQEAMAWLAWDNSALSGAFLRGAMAEADSRERAHTSPRGRTALWVVPRSSTRFLPVVVGGQEAGRVLDLPASLLGDLAHHPGDALAFLDQDEARADYWVSQRDYRDDFAGLAAALDAAATDPEVRAAHSEEAARVAALAVNSLGARQDFGQARTDGTQPAGASAAGSLGHVLATHVEAVNWSITNGRHPSDTRETKDRWSTDSRPLPVFSTDVLPGVLHVVGRDGGALLGLRGAQNGYQEQVIKPGVSREEFERVCHKLGQVEAYIARYIGVGDVDDAAAHDKYIKAWIDLVGTSASRLSDLEERFGPGTGGASSWEAGRLVNHLAQRAEKSWARSTVGEPGEEPDYSRLGLDALEQLSRSVMLAADADGLVGYGDGDRELNRDDPAAVENPDGTYRLITRDEYEDLVLQAEDPQRRQGESDTDFKRRQSKASAAQERLSEVNMSLNSIVRDDGGGYADLSWSLYVELSLSDDLTYAHGNEDDSDDSEKNVVCAGDRCLVDADLPLLSFLGLSALWIGGLVRAFLRHKRMEQRQGEEQRHGEEQLQGEEQRHGEEQHGG